MQNGVYIFVIKLEILKCWPEKIYLNQLNSPRCNLWNKILETLNFNDYEHLEFVLAWRFALTKIKSDKNPAGYYTILLNKLTVSSEYLL